MPPPTFQALLDSVSVRVGLTDPLLRVFEIVISSLGWIPPARHHALISGLNRFLRLSTGQDLPEEARVSQHFDVLLSIPALWRALRSAITDVGPPWIASVAAPGCVLVLWWTAHPSFIPQSATGLSGQAAAPGRPCCRSITSIGR